jgi:glycosyltransferase involved in cell wall biosynthesis
MTVPRISVVMSVFNGERFLCEAIESILDQSLIDLEFIIIDDGSTDNSASILASYRRKDARVHVYHQENRGLSDSLNRGCGLARGKYVARMDADDIAFRNRLALQIEFMEAHPEVAVVGGAVEFVDATGKVLTIARYPCENREIQSALLDASVLWHPTVLLRKEVFAVVGGYRKIAEDYDLWLRIAEHFQLANLDAVVLKYRLHPYQISVRKVRQQALGAAAVQAAAWSRRNGNPDPLEAVEEVTSAMLGQLGVSESTLQTTLGRGYLSCIRNMVAAGEYSLAFDALEEVRSSEFPHADNWVVADFRSLAARLYWHQKRFARSILSAGHAVITRPIMLGRPLKPFLRRFGLVGTKRFKEIRSNSNAG